MRRWDPLKPHQLVLLRRIAAGDTLSAPGLAPERRSAGALRDRGLVEISKRAGWRATLTAAGQFYLDHGLHPDHPDAPARPTTTHRRIKTARPKVTAKVAATESETADRVSDSANETPRKRRPPHRTARIVKDRHQAASDLIAHLVVNTAMVIQNPDDEELTKWRRIVDFAKRNRLTPPGTRLERSRPYGRHLRIELVCGMHPNARPDPAMAPAVFVPAEVDRWHPLLANTAQTQQRLSVSTNSFLRARRILHALISEAARRRHGVSWVRERGGVLRFVVDGYAYELELREECSDQGMFSLTNGKLRIEVETGYEFRGRPRKWADRQRWCLEDRLGDVLAELEERSRLAAERALAERLARAQRRQNWEAAIVVAHECFREQQRIAALEAQLHAWEMAGRVERYCDALDQAVITRPELAATVAPWIAWCRTYADSVNPVGRDDLPPRIVEPRKYELEPYLDGWSPYGPDEPFRRRAN